MTGLRTTLAGAGASLIAACALLLVACACSRAERGDGAESGKERFGSMKQPPTAQQPAAPEAPSPQAPSPQAPSPQAPSPQAQSPQARSRQAEARPEAVLRSGSAGISREGLESLKRAHDAADHATSESDKHRAIDLLMHSLDSLSPEAAGAPKASAPAEGPRFVYQDGWARIAELELELGDLQATERAINQGLSAGKQASVPVATLLELRGTLHERQGDKSAAAEAYHEALIVNQQLMQQSLNAPGEDEP